MPRWSAIVAAAVTGIAALAAKPPTTALVITGARVLDVSTGRTSTASAVVIEDGRISAIHGEPASIPSLPSTVDGSGLTLVPGLADLVVDAAPSAWIDPDYYYALGLAYGVTAYRLVDAPVAWGADQRRRSSSLDLLAPRLWVTGPGLELRPGADDDQTADAATLDGRVRVNGIDGLEREIARSAVAKADWVHLGPTVGPDGVRVAVAAARRARLKVSAEPGKAGLMDLARAGVDAIVGLGPAGDRVEPTEAQPLARALAKAPTVLIPMLRQSADPALGAASRLVARELQLLPGRFRDDVQRRIGRGGDRAAERAWRLRGDFVRAFVSAGGRIAIGSGSGPLGWPVPGLSAIHELQLLVDSGVSAPDALRAATVTGLTALGAGDRAGRIRVGAPADVVGVGGDPAKDIRSLVDVRLIVRGGALIEREDLVKQAARAASRIR